MRARPVKSKLAEVVESPVAPRFQKNQRGMTAGAVLEETEAAEAVSVWVGAMKAATTAAAKLAELGVAKQWANRLLEPFAYQKMLVTATDFDNFFRLRIADDAQPEIQELAVKMKEARDGSSPRQLDWDQWHLPYLSLDEFNKWYRNRPGNPLGTDDVAACSAARCARVSYCSHDGTVNFEKDLALAAELLVSGHANPFEHPARPAPTTSKYANFRGWTSLRYRHEQSGRLANPKG